MVRQMYIQSNNTEKFVVLQRNCNAQFNVTTCQFRVLFRAKGLQSIVQLMGEKDLFDYWSDTYKVHTLEWSREKAFEILKEWQAKFSEEVSRLVPSKSKSVKSEKYSKQKYEIHAFSSSHLDSILKEFSEFNWRNIGLACAMMVSLLYTDLPSRYYVYYIPPQHRIYIMSLYIFRWYIAFGHFLVLLT